MIRIGLLAILLALSGCAGMDALENAYLGIQDYFVGKDNVEPPAELKEFEPVVQMTKLWEAEIGDGYDEQAVNLGPSVDETRVFIAERKGTVEARDRLTGERLWSVNLEMELSSGPVVDGDLLFLTTAEAEVLALKAADGSLSWKTPLAGEILSQPVVADDIVVIRGTNGYLSALDRNTGATRWYFERHAPPLAVRSRGSPIIAGDLVIDGFGGGKVSALQLKDGQPAWEAVVSLPHGRSEIERLVDLGATPVVRGDAVFVSGYQGGVAALGLNTGDVLWKREDLSAPVGMSADRSYLYVTDTNADVWQLEARRGADLWKQNELHQRRLTAPTLVRDYLAVGDFEGYLHLLNQEDGRVVGRLRVAKAAIEVPPVVFHEVIYVYASDGTLAAVSVQ